MAYSDLTATVIPKSSGVVVPLLDGRGNPYPEFLRTQQVGLGVVRAVVERIDAALAGGPIRLDSVHLGEGGKAHFKWYLLQRLLPELWGDPVPRKVKAAPRIVSRKALGLLNRRLAAAFDPPGGSVRLPGVTLTRKDLFPLLQLLHEALLGDDAFADESEADDQVPPPLPPAGPRPAGPPVAVGGDEDLSKFLP